MEPLAATTQQADPEEEEEEPRWKSVVVLGFSCGTSNHNFSHTAHKYYQVPSLQDLHTSTPVLVIRAAEFNLIP